LYSSGLQAVKENMDTIGEIIKYLLVFMGVMFLLLIIVLAVLWKMSPTHPWRLVVAAFARRVAATGGIAGDGHGATW
jgi:hypothetical protein